MVVTNKVKVDLERLSAPSVIYAVQSDQYSRDVEFSLYSNGVEWSPETNSNIIASFEKPDGTGGQYNTLPSSESAYSVSGNKVTVAIAPQVLTVPGIVYFSVGLVSGNSTIYTFPIQINVQENPGISATSEDYFNISGFLSNSGWTPNMFLATDANGNVVAKAGSGGGGGTGDCVFTSLHLTDGILTMDASKNGYFSITSDDDIVVKLGDISIPTGKNRLLAYLYYNHSNASGVIPENTAFSATDIQTGVIYGGNTLGSATTTFPYIRTINGKTPDSNGDIEIETTGGSDGYSPVANVEQTDTGAVISITDKTGTTTATVTNGKDGAPGQNGSDYVLTDDDISEIAERAATLVPAGTSEVFIATYGETTYAEIEEAVNAGKICLCQLTVNGSEKLLLTSFSSERARFLCAYAENTSYALFVNGCRVDKDNKWFKTQTYTANTITSDNKHIIATERAVYNYAQPKGDYLTQDTLTSAVDNALAQAKASGEFDGADGKDGSDYVLTDSDRGEIATQAAALVDISGKLDKNQGSANAGKTLTVGSDGNLILTDMPEGGSGGTGADGYSPIAEVTQTDNGAVITITDKNGTTTATVTNGKDGQDGQDGYTPQKGVDYFTESEKTEMVNAVIAALPIYDGSIV